MRIRSKKQEKITEELHRVYQEIDTEREPICTGCGRGDVPLSHSHLISRKKRPDLITEKRNIQFHCLSIGGREGCHDRWDRNDTTLLDWDENMAYIKEVDTMCYELRS